ncbi:MAG: DUF502 domain-containing protein [Candidatus Omnitrophica bacterium]|nr:DUF502 domain-containing protein [Candidatus Omnitrophota bacterium]
MFTKIRNNFITGVAILLPVALTIIVVRFLAVKINSFILNPLVKLLNLNPYLTEHSLYIAKVLVFVIVVLLISIVGWAANIIFLRKLFSFGERMFIRVPMIGKVYSVIKEIGSAFLGKDKAFFQKVVLIEYPRKGIYSIGFVTGEGTREMQNFTGKELVSIFVPTTPNPTSGVFLMVPRNEMKFLDMTVEEGLKLVVSSGTVTSRVKSRK